MKGRPRSFTGLQEQAIVVAFRAGGITQRSLAYRHGTSVGTVQRVLKRWRDWKPAGTGA